MAKKIYISTNDTLNIVKKLYVGVNDISRKVKKGYIGVDNVARLFYVSEYVWKRYNVIYTYYWDKYNSVTQHKWNKFFIQKLYDDVFSSTYEISEMRLSSNGPITTQLYSGYSFNQDTGAMSLSNMYTYDQYGDNNINAYVLYNGKYYHISRINYWMTGTEALRTYYMYFYGELITPTIINNKGEFIEMIYYNNTKPYPDDGVYGDYWYTYIGSEQIKGDTNYGQVNSNVISEYPDNGLLGDYWYVKNPRIDTAIGSYIDNVVSDEPNMYPENGIKDGYWYVKQPI